jgi:hypothetical protein
LAQAVGAERLDVVAAIEGRRVGDGAAAEAAARLPQRGVFTLLEPVLHVGEDAADVVDAMDVEGRGHHGHVGAGHDALEDIFGGVNASGDGDVDIEMAVEDGCPMQARQQFRWRGEVQRGADFKSLDIEVGLIEAIEENDAARAGSLVAARPDVACW